MPPEPPKGSGPLGLQSYIYMLHVKSWVLRLLQNLMTARVIWNWLQLYKHPETKLTWYDFPRYGHISRISLDELASSVINFLFIG